jgi:hypothetical protein
MCIKLLYIYVGSWTFLRKIRKESKKGAKTKKKEGRKKKHRLFSAFGHFSFSYSVLVGVKWLKPISSGACAMQLLVCSE